MKIPANLGGERRSSRRRSSDAGAFFRESASNRSLERGLAVLRAFRPGVGCLTTSDVAERTKLPLPTVSRLLATLVRSGFLTYDFDLRGYSLGVPLLSLGHSYTEGSRLLTVALPLMSALADSQRVNVGLASEDMGEIVYLQSLRGNRADVLRRIVPGSRAPLELTAIGRAWLAASPAAVRNGILKTIAPRYGRRWPGVLAEIRESRVQLGTQGYCISRWQTGSVGLARPLGEFSGRLYAVNITFFESARTAVFLREQGQRLIELARQVEEAVRAGSRS
jgi:DNA-binding IclR family transcriptional regulator